MYSLFNNIRPIFVLGPMESEYRLLADSLENKSVSIIDNYEFSKGTIDGYPVIVCHCLIGVVNSTISTYYNCDNSNNNSKENLTNINKANSVKINKNELSFVMKHKELLRPSKMAVYKFGFKIAK